MLALTIIMLQWLYNLNSVDIIFVQDDVRVPGTTWTQELVWCLVHGRDHKDVSVNMMTRFPFLEWVATNIALYYSVVYYSSTKAAS